MLFSAWVGGEDTHGSEPMSKRGECKPRDDNAKRMRAGSEPTTDLGLGANMDDDTFLALFSYERRIPLGECATSPLNRNGEPTRGKHARDLIERILTTDPFRERRYKFALAHEPDPAAQQAVNNHYNAFAEKIQTCGR